MKRHFTDTETGYLCCACRQAFTSTKDLARHCDKGGKCKHPMALGMRLDIEVSHRTWTSKKVAAYKAA